MCSPASNALNKVKLPVMAEVLVTTPAIIGSRLEDTLTYPGSVTVRPYKYPLRGIMKSSRSQYSTK